LGHYLEPVSEQALVMQAAQGDRLSFEKLIKRHWPDLMLLCSMLKPGAISLEEVHGRSARRAFSLLQEQGIASEEEFVIWYSRILIKSCLCANIAIRLATRRRSYTYVRRTIATITQLNPDTCASTPQRLQTLLLLLPRRERVLLVLHDVVGLTTEQIHTLCKLPARKQEQLLTSARSVLKKELSDGI